MDLRLKSMSRSLESVILPAIDPENALALTQAHVIMAHIGLIRNLLDHLPEYGRLEHRSQLVFAGEVAAVAEGGPAVDAAVSELRDTIAAAPADELLATPSELHASVDALAVAATAVVEAMGIDGDIDARARIITISMESLGETATRELRLFDASQDPAALLAEWRASLMEGAVR
jgi:hypothetical protein